MKNRVTGILLFVSLATILPAQDAVPAPPADKKGGGRPARPPRPGVATPGVKREMTTLTPAAVISIPGTPDWQVMTDDAMWVSNGSKNTVHRIDVKTNEQVAIDAGRRPCSGLAAGFGSVWVPLCGDRPGTENGAKPAVARIDTKTKAVVATISVGVANSEGGIAASPDAIWILSDIKGTLSRIDPATNLVAGIVRPAGPASAPVVIAGAAWVSVDARPAISAYLARLSPERDAVDLGLVPSSTFGGGGDLIVAAGSAWVIDGGNDRVLRLPLAGFRS